MSPHCTGNPEQPGRWVCPYCSPCSKPIECYSVVEDPQGAQHKIHCAAPCTHAGFHGKDPGEYWKHIQAAHGWDGRDLKKEPPRLLDTFKAPTAPPTPGKRQLPVQRKGPSKSSRAKARAKRKKKKKK